MPIDNVRYTGRHHSPPYILCGIVEEEEGGDVRTKNVSDGTETGRVLSCGDFGSGHAKCRPPNTLKTNCGDFKPDGHLDLAVLRMSKTRLDISIQCVQAEEQQHPNTDHIDIYSVDSRTPDDQTIEQSWLYGDVGGRKGIFPCEYLVPLSRNKLVELTTKQEPPHRCQQHNPSPESSDDLTDDSIASNSPKPTPSNPTHQTHINARNNVKRASSRQRRPSLTWISPPQTCENDAVQSHWTEQCREFNALPNESGSTTTNDGKHSLLRFALAHFRQSCIKPEKRRTVNGNGLGLTSFKIIDTIKSKKKDKKDSDWTWRDQVQMVKYTEFPIQASLVKLDSQEQNKLAIECFLAIMRYMGDYPMESDQSEVGCVYTVLINCHRHTALRDEVYCQIMKQTTNNKSNNADSCQRGWRLFSILSAYFQCSDHLKPYLYQYLETVAYDTRRAFHGSALVCLQNLNKTFEHGGRKNVPSAEEVEAISAGRYSKRQVYRLPGGSERIINTRSTTVVEDILEVMCEMINVRKNEQNETDEFSLYCIVEGDTLTMPLAGEEYILDVTTELQRNRQVFYLIFCRSVWYYPMRLDNQLYIDVVFNQMVPDYLEGLLLIMPSGQLNDDHLYDLTRVTALLHRAAEMVSPPTIKETRYLLPKPVLTVREIKPHHWVNMVRKNWKEAEQLTSTEAKAQVLEILQMWPLFGSSFFSVKEIRDKEDVDAIMALNRDGVHFLDVNAHETLQCYTFSQILSTRKVKDRNGRLFLDMKCGNLVAQQITRIQTEQAHEISRLIRQYISMEQRNRALMSSDLTAPETSVPR